MTVENLSLLVTAAAAIATAFATLVLAIVTWLLFKATRQMAAATSEAYVIATLEPNRWSFIHMDLLIQNTGNGPAFDVVLAFDPPLVRDRQGDQNALPVNSMSILRPSQTLYDYIGNGSNFLQNSYKVEISWKSSPNAKIRTTNRYEMNLKHYNGLIELGGRHPQVQIAQDLKKLREKIDQMVGGFRRMPIDIYNNEDREREAEAHEASWRRQEGLPPEAPPATPPKPRRPRKPQA